MKKHPLDILTISQPMNIIKFFMISLLAFILLLRTKLLKKGITKMKKWVAFCMLSILCLVTFGLTPPSQGQEFQTMPNSSAYSLQQWRICRRGCDFDYWDAIEDCPDLVDASQCYEDAINDRADCYNACDYGTGSPVQTYIIPSTNERYIDFWGECDPSE